VSWLTGRPFDRHNFPGVLMTSERRTALSADRVMPNEREHAGFNAASVAVGAAIGARGQPPSSVRGLRGLERWVESSLKPLAGRSVELPLTVHGSAGDVLHGFRADVQAVARLAAIWRKSLGRKAWRFEIVADPDAPEMALRVAADPRLKTLSVWSRRASQKHPAMWRWPIDISSLSQAGGEAIGSDVASLIERKSYLDPLVEYAGENRTVATDILLLRGTTERILKALAEEHPPKASLVLLQTTVPPDVRKAARILFLVRTRFPGSAVAWVPVPNAKFQRWLEATIRELSHNEPLDVAIFRAGKAWHPLMPPIIVAPAGFMEKARLGRSIERLEWHLRSPQVRDRSMAIAPRSRAAEVLATSGEMSAGDVGDRLRSVPRDTGFARESGLATASVELTAAAPPAEVHRFLQSRVVETVDGNQKRTTWLADATNVVEARIGAEAEGWPRPAGASPFPVEELLADEVAVEVEVLCYLPGDGPPLRQNVTIRRARDSAACRFEVHVATKKRQFAVRIVVMYGGRLIQAGTLSGPVRITPGEEHSPAEFRMEALVRSNIRSLRTMRRVDGTLLVAPGSTEVFDGVKGFRAPQILNTLLERYDALLSDVAENPDNYKTLDSGASLDLIRELAQIGSEVRDELKDAGLSDAVLKGKRLQVVEIKSGVRVPVELFYDGEAPQPNTKLCRNWKAGLQQGECSATCPADEGGDTHICPRRFWGLSRVIERHLEASGDPDWDGDFGVRPEPGDRSELRLFRASAVAGSNRVNKHAPNGLASLRKQLEKQDGVAAHHVLAGNWTDWEKAIRMCSPSLLLLLPHTAMQGVQPELEIGGDVKLTVNLTPAHIGDAGNKPVVVLLGCQTDTHPANFFSIVSRCRRKGAVIVIAFGATIAVKHAVPAAKQLVRQLAAAASAKPSAVVGDAMLKTRRALVAAGWIAALGLTAYGDGDWKLVK
jgi:hypothetical protein